MEAAVFLFVNVIKRYQFKAKDSEVNPYLLCLGNISIGFTIRNKEKTLLLPIMFWIFINI